MMSFRFKETTGVVASLEVQGPHGRTSLEQLYRLLLALRVQLLGATELRAGERLVFELSVCDLDGGKLKDARRRSILAELAEHVANVTGDEQAA